MLTHKHLSYFVALAEHRSFSAAAEAVHVTQPALSQQIKEMETRLGVQLVERLPRDIRLTRAGQLALERAQVILGLTRDLEAEIRLSRGLGGRLTLGVIPTIAPYLLPRALTRVKAAHLEVDIRVREAQTADLLTALAAGHLDAALIALPYELHGLVAEVLFDDHFLLAGSASRIAALGQGALQRPADLPPDALLLLDEGHCLADQALDVCGLKRRPAVDLGASSLSTLCGLVSQGFGLTFVPEMALPTECAAAPDMAVMRFPQPQPKRQIALVRRARASEIDWFAQLCTLIAQTGQELRAELPDIAAP